MLMGMHNLFIISQSLIINPESSIQWLKLFVFDGALIKKKKVSLLMCPPTILDYDSYLSLTAESYMWCEYLSRQQS